MGIISAEQRKELKSKGVSMKDAVNYGEAKDALTEKRLSARDVSVNTKTEMSNMEKEKNQIEEDLKKVGPDQKKERELESRKVEIEKSLTDMQTKRDVAAKEIKEARANKSQYENESLSSKILKKAANFRSKTTSGKSATAKPKPEVNANPLPGQGPAASAANEAAKGMMGGSSAEIVTKDNDLTKL